MLSKVKNKHLSIIKAIGYDCHIWRKEHGIDITKIADSAGVVRTRVSNFEHGRNVSLALLLTYIQYGYTVQNYAYYRRILGV